MDFRRKNSQSQKSIQHFKFSRTFFSTGRPTILPAGPLLLNCQCWKKCGKIQNVVSNSDFEIFSPEIHALGWDIFRVLTNTVPFDPQHVSKKISDAIGETTGVEWPCIASSSMFSSLELIASVHFFPMNTLDYYAEGIGNNDAFTSSDDYWGVADWPLPWEGRWTSSEM